jgi:hypothetical protein
MYARGSVVSLVDKTDYRHLFCRNANASRKYSKLFIALTVLDDALLLPFIQDR